MRYLIYVNGRQKYKGSFTHRKAQDKAEWLRRRGFASVEVVEDSGAPKNKYGAIRTDLDGITFDSRAEASYYAELLILHRAGIVTDIVIKPRYTILDSYPHPVTGKIMRGIVYEADFKVTYKGGEVQIVDVKSRPTRTPTYKIKKKLFESRYGQTITEVEL